MCMEDVRLGRKTVSTQSNVSISNANSSVLVGQNAHRTVLVISAPLTGYITLAIDNDAVLNSGINLFALDSPLQFDIQRNGDLVTRKFSAIHSVAIETIGVFEGQLLGE